MTVERVNALFDQIGEVLRQVGELNGTVKAIQTDIQEVRSDISSVRHEGRDVAQKVVSVHERLTSIGDRVGNLEEPVAEFRVIADKVESFQAPIDDWKATKAHARGVIATIALVGGLLGYVISPGHLLSLITSLWHG